MENNSIVLTNNNGQAVVSSRQVANDFGKQHKNVIRSIETTIDSAQNCAQWFFATEYTDASGKANKEYLLNRDGFSLIVMGFTGKKAAGWKVKYIEAFNSMEQQLLLMKQDSYMITDPVARAQKWIEEEQQRQALAARIEEHKETIAILEPKAELADRLAGTEDWISIGEVAKTLAIKGFGQNNLFRFLQRRGVIIDSKHPYQQYVNNGCFKICEKPYFNEYVGEERTSLQIKASQKGVAYINKLIRQEIEAQA